MSADRYSIARHISMLYKNSQSSVTRSLENTGIGSGQFGILLTLARKDGIRQEELADYLKTDKGCIAKSVKKLELDGYVERCDDEDDGRAYRVTLTQKARDILPEVQRAIQSWETSITAVLTEEEKLLLERLLCKMAEKAYSVKTINGENEG